MRDVALRLTRTAGGTAARRSTARSERFVRMSRCGAKRGPLFRASARRSGPTCCRRAWPAGRYVLDVRATDRAGNTDTLLQRTRTRVVFTVR